MNAEELREAVNRLGIAINSASSHLDPRWALALDDYQRLVDAARLIALPILEVDEGLVERIAGALCNHTHRDGTPAPCDRHMDAARTVLKALAPVSVQ